MSRRLSQRGRFASASDGTARAPARDEDQERRVRLLLLGKGAALAHWFHRPLAAGMDENQQRSVSAGTSHVDCSVRVKGALRSRVLHSRDCSRLASSRARHAEQRIVESDPGSRTPAEKTPISRDRYSESCPLTELMSW